MIETVLRITFSLLAVLGLMWGMARLARRPLSRRTGSALSVLARQQLSRNAAVTVVRVADRALILGVTDTHVTMLGETDLAVVEEHQAVPAGGRRRHVDKPTDTDRPDDTPGTEVPDGTGWPGLPAEGDRPLSGQEQRQRVALDRAGHPVQGDEHGRLDGSILSPRTWRRTINFIRDRTARR